MIEHWLMSFKMWRKINFSWLSPAKTHVLSFCTGICARWIIMQKEVFTLTLKNFSAVLQIRVGSREFLLKNSNLLSLWTTSSHVCDKICRLIWPYQSLYENMWTTRHTFPFSFFPHRPTNNNNNESNKDTSNSGIIQEDIRRLLATGSPTLTECL